MTPAGQAKVRALEGRNCPAIHTMKLNPRPEHARYIQITNGGRTETSYRKTKDVGILFKNF